MFGEGLLEWAAKCFIIECFCYLKDQIRWQTGMKKELQKLQKIHPKIQAAVSAYNKAQIEDPDLNQRYWELRDSLDEADDVLDEFAYWKLDKQHNKNNKLRKVHSRIGKFCKRAFKRDPSLKRLLEAVQKCDASSSELDIFFDRLEQKKQQPEPKRNPKTDSFVGREQEMELLKVWLSESYQPNIDNNNDEYKNISLLCVVGLGGMGKSALLQQIFLDESTAQEYEKIWVRVSHNFKAERVITKILDHFKEPYSSDAIFLLQETLQNKLKAEDTKKFLLVLDEIWEKDVSEWTDVLNSLSQGKLGSKILVTTRMNSVALMFSNMIKNTKEPLQLKGLDQGTCLSYLNVHEFDCELKPIAEKIVEKFSRCPLAIKFISVILKSNVDKGYWEKVLKTNVGNTDSMETYNKDSMETYKNDLMDILKISYRYLSEFERNCFTFCCIFPPEHKFDRDELVRMWIALGFIEPQNNPKKIETKKSKAKKLSAQEIRAEKIRAEESRAKEIKAEEIRAKKIGESYFDRLLENSFFEKSNNDYKVDNLLHELVQIFFRGEYFVFMNDDVSAIPNTIRHFSINTHNLEALKEIGELIKAPRKEGKSSRKEGECEILPCIGEFIELFKKEGKYKNLRSVILNYNKDQDDENFIDALSKIFKASKKIRLLVISHPILEKIPVKINRLIHLRHLKLHCENSCLHEVRKSSRDQLPESIRSLHHLLFINFKDHLI